MSDDPVARMQAQAARDQAQKDQARTRQHAESAEKANAERPGDKTAPAYDHSNLKDLYQVKLDSRAGGTQAAQDAKQGGKPPENKAQEHGLTRDRPPATEAHPESSHRTARPGDRSGPDHSNLRELPKLGYGLQWPKDQVTTSPEKLPKLGPGLEWPKDQVTTSRASDAERSWAERPTGFRQPNRPETQVDGLTDVRPSQGPGQSHEQQAPADAETKSASASTTNAADRRGMASVAADKRAQASRESADDTRDRPKAADSQKRSADAISDQQRPTLRAEHAVAGKGVPGTKKATESPEDPSGASKSTDISRSEREENFKREFFKFQQGLVDAGLRAFTPDPTNFEKSIAANPEYQDILDPNSGRLLGYAHNVTVGGISYPEIVNRDGQVTLPSLLERIEHIKGLAGEANAERNMQIRSLPIGIQQTMSLAGVVPGADWMARNPELAKAAVEAVVAFIPYIGQATMVAEAVTGRNIFGDELSRNQQALLGVLALVPLAKSLAADMRALEPLIAEAAQAAGLTEAQVSRTVTTLGGLQTSGKVIDAMNAAEHGAALMPAENLAVQDVGRQLESLAPSAAQANLAGEALSAAADDAYRQAISSTRPPIRADTLGKVGMTTSREAFRREVERIIQPADHPLHTLLDPQTGRLRSSVGKGIGGDVWNETPEMIEAGHYESAKALYGKPDRLVIMSASENRAISSVIEHPSRGGASMLESGYVVVIGDLPISATTARDLVAKNLLKAEFLANAPRLVY